MDRVPDELLLKIFSFVHDTKALGSLRLVSHRWNSITVNVWKYLGTTRAIFRNENDLADYIDTMECRIQNELPFNRIGLKGFHASNLTTLEHLFKTYRDIITDVYIDLSDLSFYNANVKNFEQLLTTLASALPMLKDLHIKSRFCIPNATSNISFPNLCTLTLEGAKSLDQGLGLLQFLSLPKLRILETRVSVIFGSKTLNENYLWPLPEEFRQIPKIRLHMSIHFFNLRSIRSLADFTQKLMEWSNIEFTTFFIQVTQPFYSPQIEIEVKPYINSIIQNQSQSIENLTVGGGIRSGDNSFNFGVPVLPKLKFLFLKYRNQELFSLNDVVNSLPDLHKVTLGYFLELKIIFGATVLTTVEQLTLLDNGRSYNLWTLNNATPFHAIFPNLQTFAYIHMNEFDGQLNLDHIGYLVSTMRMGSLHRLKYILDTEENRLQTIDIQLNSRINEIFSGFDGTQNLIQKLILDTKNNADRARNFWIEMEKVRRPCIVNMPGLKSFVFNYPIDDTFSTVVLMQMKRLDLLSIHLKNVSENLCSELMAHHNCIPFTGSLISDDF